MILQVKVYGSSNAELVKALEAITQSIQTDTLNGSDQCMRGNQGYFAVYKTKAMAKQKQTPLINI